MRDARDKAAIEAELASLKAQLESSRIFTASLQQVTFMCHSPGAELPAIKHPTHVFNSFALEFRS
jgi:hypothetical protein